MGELVAHAAPCNSVADLLSWLSLVLGSELKDAFATAVDPSYRHEPAGAPRLVESVDDLLADVGEAFRLRHIFAHEAAPSVVVDEETCVRLLDSVRLWMRATNAVLWPTVSKNKPLTTLEMRQHAVGEVSSARNQLATVMRTALRIERKTGTSGSLWKNHRDWRRVVNDWLAMTYSRLDGTMWPAIRAADFASAVRARAKQVGD